MKKLLAAMAAAGLVASVSVSVAGASVPTRKAMRSASDGVIDSPYETSVQAELPPAPDGLPASRSNMKLVSKLRLTDSPAVISDVSYHRGFAYLGEWFAACDEGGAGYDAEIHVVNMKNPRSPREVSTIPLTGADWAGEGVDLIRFKKRDYLLLSSEPCDSTTDGAWGGMHIVDVTNPRNPQMIATNFGDKTIGGVAGEVEDRISAHSNHSVMGWVDGNKAFAVMVDNEEFPDVDIADITPALRKTPGTPVMISEVGLEEFAAAGMSTQTANGDSIFHHDMQVKRVGGEWHILVSYWDAGWVLLQVENPAEPQFVRDSDYPTPDPLTGYAVPEGNGHQAWWSADNKFIVSSDEDFNPIRLVGEITSGTFQGDNFPASNGSGTPPVDDESPMVGPTRYVGRACTADGPIAAPGSADEIALVQRGACTFTEKTANVEAAGYAGIIVFNSNAGANGGCSSVVGASVEGGIPFLGVGRDTGFKLLNLSTYDEEACLDATQDDSAGLPAPGTAGQSVSVTGEFDGWGYIHLLNGSTLEEIDAYAVDEALDPRFKEGFGDLSVHEIKTDWRRSKHLGYAAYYSAGARVLKFNRKGIREKGHFIDRRGNNFWGVWPLKRGNRRPLLLFSDRDFGLYTLKYTGPQ